MKSYEILFQTDKYRFLSKDNILEEKDLGICADIASVLTPEHSVAAVECFQGCPYTDSGFLLDLISDGERIRTQRWEWLPNAMLRHAETDTFALDTLTAVVPGMRAFVLKAVYTNRLKHTMQIPIQISYGGCPRKEENWNFNIPNAGRNSLKQCVEMDGMIVSESSDVPFALTCSAGGLRLFRSACLWEGTITVPADESVSVYISANMGNTAYADAKQVMNDYEAAIEASFSWFLKEAERIQTQLPQLTSDNPRLDNLYYRSLVTYILCRWENPALCSIPYFSTGSINGACMCSYLWDYCGGLMLHPLYDAEGNKKQLIAYLKNDLTTSYALNPVTGGKVGPWYQVNQEKIICMVYYHVLFTGDKAFLFEQAGNKTVLEWMLYHAYVGDDGTEGNRLCDYGEGGKDHLELRQRWKYNGVMPDVNARRYMNYKRVYDLTKVAGAPDERLLQRAAELKECLKSLWNEQEKWYDFIDNTGKRDIRYTVQMFKFLNSPVIDAHERDGLISHLNETEFLSKYGLHSMSKLDEAFDQEDIDNGGGGICTHFTMQICAQLYEMGYDALATDILQRVYWWGERMPYMGDSCAANMIQNREDTPLQGDISSVACAQMIFYYIFGIRAAFDGAVTVTPVKHRPAERMKIENARLCGKTFSVCVDGDMFSVAVNDRTYTAAIGETVCI